MARRKSSQYRSEAKHDPFELELDGGGVITFLDPSRLDAETAFDFARRQDPKRQLQMLLSEDDYESLWAEWRSRPVGELNELLTDVMEHYGSDVGKPATSRS